MKKLFFLSCLAACCLNAAAQEPATIQRINDTAFEYDVLRTIDSVRFYLFNSQNMRQVDEARFMQGFLAQLHQPTNEEQDLLEKMQAWEQAETDHIKQQIQAVDFLTPHAEQVGVTLLSNGLQYDCYTLPQAAQNYKARRAHKWQGYIPGTNHRVAIDNMPDAINEALYQAPRAGAWRFLLPAELLATGKDTDALKSRGIHTVEIIAVREAADERFIQQARDYFASKNPPLPGISDTTPELMRELSELLGMMAAKTITKPSPQLIAEIEKRLPQLLCVPNQEFDTRLQQAYSAYLAAREDLRRSQHRNIAADIMHMQQQLPGTITLSNGVLCRVKSNGGQAIPFAQARFIEEEEPGTETYLRVRDRIINAENDLPDALLEVANEIPQGNSWELVVPPTLRGEDHALPLLYRVRTSRPMKNTIEPLQFEHL